MAGSVAGSVASADPAQVDPAEERRISAILGELHVANFEESALQVCEHAGEAVCWVR